MVPNMVAVDRSEYDAERYLLRRAGYGPALDYPPCVVLCRMEASGVDRNATYDPYAWGQGTRSDRADEETEAPVPETPARTVSGLIWLTFREVWKAFSIL